MDGELGNGSATGPAACSGASACSTTPVTVSGITNATGVSVGANFACALLSGGTVQCWGYNGFGNLRQRIRHRPRTPAAAWPLSRAPLPTPVTVSGINDAIAISAGAFDACALLSGGTVQCWGDNLAGELGIGSGTGPETCNGGQNPCSTTPVTVSGITDATAIAVGTRFACALKSSGAVNCWGDKEYGAVGEEGGPGSYASAPVTVSGITSARGIAVGNDFSCALLAGGTMQCWGDNGTKQLTNPALTSSSTPVSVQEAPLNVQTNTFVLKTELLPGAPQAPVLWTAGVGIGDTSNYPQSLALDRNDDIVLVTTDPNSTEGTLRRICSDGSANPAVPCVDGSLPWSNAGSFSVATVDSLSNVYAAGLTYSGNVGAPFVKKYDVTGADQWPNSSSATAVCSTDTVNACQSIPRRSRRSHRPGRGRQRRPGELR